MQKKLILLMSLIFLMGCSRLGGTETRGTQNELAEATRTVQAATPVQPPATPSGQPSPTPEVIRGTVTIWHSLGEEQMVGIEQILENFSAQHPEVLFDVLYIPQENLPTRLESAVQENAGPDLVLGPAGWGPAFYRDGMIQDLSDLAQDALRMKINPAALAAGSYQDAQVGLPYAQEGVVLYRNKALIEHPAATLEELIRAANAATQGEMIGADLERGFLYSGGYLDGLGGKLVNEDGTPAFNSEKGLAWLQVLQMLEQAGPTEYNSDRDIELFKEGRVGWIVDGTWNYNALTEAVGAENLAVDPWPTAPGGNLSGYIQPSNIYLSTTARGDDRTAAGKFIEHFLSAESQSILSEVGMIPVVSGVKMTDPRRQAQLTQILTALAGGTAYPTVPEIRFFPAALDAALQSVLLGNVPPAEALSSAEGVIRAALAQAQVTPTP